MNRQETDSEKLERQQSAIADLRLEQGADEAALWGGIHEAAHRATTDNWPEMPESERQLVVEAVVGLTAIKYQLSIFRNGWSTGQDSERIQVDPEIAGPRILIRAYATAEADTVRMRGQAERQSGQAEERPSLEERIRRYLPPPN
jgi:hypothetical protein